MMTKSKMNMIRVARHVVIRQSAHAVVEISVAKMAGLIATMKTRSGTMKMIPKCVPSVGGQALKDGVLNVVLICRERAEQKVQWTMGSLRSLKHHLRLKLIRLSERILIPPHCH